MKKAILLALALGLLLALIPAAASAVEIITGTLPYDCAVGVPPDYLEFSNPIYWVYYPEKDNLVAKCAAHFDNPPAEKLTYNWPDNAFCVDFEVGTMCTSGGVSTIYPDGRGNTIWKFERP